MHVIGYDSCDANNQDNGTCCGFDSCVANYQDDSINRYLRRDCFLQRGSRYYVMGLDSCDANNQDNDLGSDGNDHNLSICITNTWFVW